jgi:hypothetical protein
MDQQRNAQGTHARLSAEMRSADDIRARLNGNIMGRFLDGLRNSDLGQALGSVYDSPAAKFVATVAGQAANEIVIRGWTGRYWLGTDQQQGQTQGPQQNAGLQSNFYGWNRQQSAEQGREREQDKSMDIGR